MEEKKDLKTQPANPIGGEKVEGEAREKMEDRFIFLGWFDGEYFVWDKKNDVAYGFIYRPSEEDVERISKEYERDFLMSIAKREPVDAHDYYNLPDGAKKLVETLE